MKSSVKSELLIRLKVVLCGGIAWLATYACSRFAEKLWEDTSPDYFLQGMNGHNVLGLFPFGAILTLIFYMILGRILRYIAPAQTEKKKRISMVSALLLFSLLSIACLIISAGNFFYLSESRIDYRPLPFVSLHSYSWSDVKFFQVKCMTGGRGTHDDFDFTLHLKDHTSIDISTADHSKFFAAYTPLKRAIDSHAIPAKIIPLNKFCVNSLEQRYPSFTRAFFLNNHYD